ncbi:MAG: NAD(P)-dependent oxidoreductase [Candidatus Bathyarchaeia archaeon]
MSVIVTGMGGVGVNVAKRFLDEGYRVVCYDVTPRRGIDLLEEAGSKVTFVRGDLLDLPFLLETVRSHEAEGIIHTAIIYPLPFERPTSVFRGTVEMQQVVLEAARLEDLKVVSMSSEAVYGPQPDLRPLREDDPTPRAWSTNPAWRMADLYIAVKVAGEQLSQAYHYVYGLDTVVIRSAEVFGPAEHTVHRPIPYFAAKAIRKEPVRIESGGDHAKEYTYAKDLARGIYAAYTVRPLKNRVFNVTGGRLVSLREVAEAVKRAVPGAVVELGPGELKPEGGEHQGLRAHMNSIWGHGPCDLSRAREELGYEPTPFEEAVKDYVAWLRRQVPPM